MLGHWNLVETDNDPNDFFGMVYLITCLETNRKYVGRKQFRSRQRKKVTGRKNRKVCIKESDWKDYTGSCVELNEDIDRLGKDKFKFEILKWCRTKRDLGYTEVKEQFARDVLNSKLPNGDREYYNANIMSRWFCSNGNKETGKRISEKMKGNRNAAGCKGNVLSEEHKLKISIAHKGLRRTEEQIRKHRLQMIGRKHTLEHKRNISIGMRNYIKKNGVIDV